MERKETMRMKRVLGMALLVALAAALIGAWAPAHWASRQAIAEDLRYE